MTVIPFVFLIVLIALLVFFSYTWRVRALTNERLADRVLLIDLKSEKRPRISPILQPIPFFGIVLGLLLLIVFLLTDVYILYAIAGALIFGFVVAQLERTIYERRLLKLETQLAQAIDLMVAALQSNSTIAGALELAAREIRNPLHAILEEVAQRIQYGDDPKAVLRMLVEKIPTENFRLFATTLSVHWDVGGSLAPVIATVGSSIRDRIEVERRIRAITAQSRLSAMLILLVTYFLALVIYTYNPVGFVAFINSGIGMLLVGCALLLQAIGLIILALMNRARI